MHAVNRTNRTDRMIIDMASLLPGFRDVVHDSQAVFRALLDALARPGSIVSIDAALGETAPRARVQRAAFASLLALADYSTPVYLHDDDRALGDAVRFHTGAPLTANRAQAVFAYVNDARTMPSLDSFAAGEPESPENAATLFIQVDSLDAGTPLTWRGPGIREARTVAIDGLPPRFWHERAALAALFPCGIDCYFVAGGSLVGLPRTTHVEVN
ncbi:carbon-phosphorus lyase complex subunit [Caballeronia telluris]|uniref:Carbon-phosphorus lyase complex subunit n=2 Tax=Caballeronia telluris TaxID=326475 RepID=A0A158H740_9BURK|nr:carbon-phosphorus lyase complex subunit [Caballeronia telluris]